MTRKSTRRGSGALIAALATASVVASAVAFNLHGTHASPADNAQAIAEQTGGGSVASHNGWKRPRPTKTTPAPSKTTTPPAPTKAPTPTPTQTPAPGPTQADVGRTYPVHTGIVSTTFWVGEIFDPNASDGSQMISTYDSSWYANYGGCDGVAAAGKCATEKRVSSNGYFPTSMKPRQNPFYLDLPYDDVNDTTGYAQRCAVIPWANDPGYAASARTRRSRT